MPTRPFWPDASPGATNILLLPPLAVEFGFVEQLISAPSVWMSLIIRSM
jgi:hypothetical protein